MKGKILSSILALGASFAVFAHGGHHMATAPMATTPEYFNGWVVGIDGSVQHMTGNVQDVPTYDGTFNGTRGDIIPPLPKQTADVVYDFESAGETSLNTDIGDTTAGGGIFVGYGKVLNNTKFYLGGEAYLRYAHNVSNTTTTDDSEFTADEILPSTTNTFTGVIDERSSIGVKSDWSYGAALKLGYLVTPKTMVYLLAGLEYSKFKVDVSHNYTDPMIIGNSNIDISNVDFTDSYSFDENKLAFVPGVGIETMLTDKLSLKAEYTYADYGDLDTQHHDATFDNDLQSVTGRITSAEVVTDTHDEDKVSLKRGLFSLGLAYHFNGI